VRIIIPGNHFHYLIIQKKKKEKKPNFDYKKKDWNKQVMELLKALIFVAFL
jgi:hypothetical protein